MEGWAPANLFKHTSWVVVGTPIDVTKSVRNQCLIEGFGGVILLSLGFSEFSVGIEAFVKRRSKIYSFFSLSFGLSGLRFSRGGVNMRYCTH